MQDAAGLRHVTDGSYKFSMADTFLLRGTIDRIERYNR